MVPKNPFIFQDNFPSQNAKTLEQLSKAKPAYQPLVFKPVVPSKQKDHEDVRLGQRLAFDGTEINVYNQSLYNQSVKSSQSHRRNYKKVQRFG